MNSPEMNNDTYVPAEDAAAAAQAASEAAEEAAKAAEAAAEAAEAATEAAEAAEVLSTAEWHSVSYGAELDATAPKRKTRGHGKRVAIIAATLACAILISLFAGVMGAMLANNYLSDQGGFGNAGGSSGGTSFGEQGGQGGQSGAGGAGGSGSSLSGETPYPADEDPYDYAAAYAALVKNNNEALKGSANGSAGDAAKSLIEVTAMVKDSVVEITTSTVSNRGTIYAGAGSGVIIHADGLIVTNHHVIEGSDEIVVRLTNGETYYATLRGSDEEGDIAILKIKPRAESPLTVAKLGYSGALALGESVIAIGNPLGELGGTVTSGIISALQREVNVDGNKMTLLQTNAAINSGNSGGGLFNMAGELVGIVNAKYSATGVEGLGFAIPIDTAYTDSFADLCNYGYIRGIPALGVTLVERSVTNGFFVTGYAAVVYDAGSAQFKKDDVIESIDGVTVYNLSSSPLSTIKSVVRSHKVGDVVEIVVARGNETVTLSVTLVEYVPQN